MKNEKDQEKYNLNSTNERKTILATMTTEKLDITIDRDRATSTVNNPKNIQTEEQQKTSKVSFQGKSSTKRLKSTGSFDSLNEYATEEPKKKKLTNETDETSVDFNRKNSTNSPVTNEKIKNRFKINFFRKKENEKSRALEEFEKSLLKPSPALPIVKFDSEGDFFKEPNESEFFFQIL